MIYDYIQSLVFLIEKLALFNKQLQGFIISLKIYVSDNVINSNKCERLLGDVNSQKFSKITSIFCIIQNSTSHGVAEEAALSECIFHVSIQLLPFNLGALQKMKNNTINRLHQLSLRIIHGDIYLTFEELLEKDNSAAMHQRNLPFLAIEIFKVNK